MSIPVYVYCFDCMREVTNLSMKIFIEECPQCIPLFLRRLRASEKVKPNGVRISGRADPTRMVSQASKSFLYLFYHIFLLTIITFTYFLAFFSNQDNMYIRFSGKIILELL